MQFLDPVPFPDGRDPSISTVVARYVSAGGLWQLDVFRVFFGFRLGLSTTRDVPGEPYGFYQEVYCMGPMRMTVMLLPRLVMKVLEPVPEALNIDTKAVDFSVIRKLLPKQTIKPMHRDEACWAGLQRSAGIEIPMPAEALALAGEITLEPTPAELIGGRA